MGACNIEFNMDGSVHFFFVEKQFKAQQKADAEENGYQEGYNGDFQTVDKVVDHSDKKEFSNYNDANDYCLNNARKGKTVIAVKYNESKVTFFK